jgi:cephalosporin hydroxylase
VFRNYSKIPRSHLRKRDLESIQRGTLSYSYKGIPCLKNPFDLALYTLLLTSIQPKTIIEIGSASGGSAWWFADQTKVLGLNTKIFSFDLNPPKDLVLERVDFLRADILDLSKSELPFILESCLRPLLVIEDGPHTYSGCRSALNFFHPYMLPGEYIVIEDGIVHEFGLTEYQDGPNRAIFEHLQNNPSNCEIDRNYCDYFGQNFTWATNGYIRYLERFE